MNHTLPGCSLKVKTARVESAGAFVASPHSPHCRFHNTCACAGLELAVFTVGGTTGAYEFGQSGFVGDHLEAG